MPSGRRRVVVRTEDGTKRARAEAGTPTVEIELAADERLISFDIHPPFRLGGAPSRKTIDWKWTARIERVLPPRRPARRRRRTGPRKAAA